jgi:phage-related holin
MEGNVFFRMLSAFFGAVIAVLEPAIPFMLICTLAVVCDYVSAWALSHRVSQKYPKLCDGKFKSSHFGRIVITLVKVYALVILAHLIDTYIIVDLTTRLPHIIAGMVCFWQVWSVLENESSCNDAKWAKIAQRIMIDKTQRHFNVDLHELLNDHPKDGEPNDKPKDEEQVNP